LDSVERADVRKAHSILGRVLPLVGLALFGLVWIWFSYALWKGCDTVCPGGWSLAIGAAALGTTVFIAADVAALAGNRRWAMRLLLAGFLTVLVWFALVAG
jgi:hypothetical protein